MKRKIFKSMFAIGTMAILGVASLNVEAKEMYAIYEKATTFRNFEETRNRIKNTHVSKLFEVPDTDILGELMGYDDFDSGTIKLVNDTEKNWETNYPMYFTYI